MRAGCKENADKEGEGRFALRLVHRYDARPQEMGKALRYICMSKAAYIGPESALRADAAGSTFLEGPGFFVKLEEEEQGPFLYV